jgi:hypothetical protein
VVYGGPGVDRRRKISNLGQMFVHKKSNIEVLMTIYSFMGSWLVLMGSCEKFRIFNCFHCFWLAIDRNLMMADLFSVFRARILFFWESFLFYCIFLIFRLYLTILALPIEEIMPCTFYIKETCRSSEISILIFSCYFS